MTRTTWETEDKTPGLGLYVRDTDGQPHILAAVADKGNGWFCMKCPIEGKMRYEILEHIKEHLEPHQI